MALLLLYPDTFAINVSSQYHLHKPIRVENFSDGSTKT